MCANAATWLTHLLLVDITDYSAAPTTTTGPASPVIPKPDARGLLALASERVTPGSDRVINGDLAFGQDRRSIQSGRDELRARSTGSDAGRRAVGLPAFASRGSVDGDSLRSLRAISKLSLSARVTIESENAGLVGHLHFRAARTAIAGVARASTSTTPPPASETIILTLRV